MPAVDINNPATIRFLIESYNKTAFLRMKWNQKNEKIVAQAATLTREAKGYQESDVAAAAMRAGLAATIRDHASNAVNLKQVFTETQYLVGISALRKGHSIADMGLGDPKLDPRLARPDTDLQLDPKMHPVDPEVRAILYKDIPVFGRKVYMKKREHILPEDKYYFPETTGCVYGWRLKDSVSMMTKKRCGRVFRLKKDVMSRSGPYPDPEHYKSSDEVVSTKCDI